MAVVWPARRDLVREPPADPARHGQHRRPRPPSTKGLPPKWERIDEWYNFRSNPRSAVHVLASLDESTYSGGAMGTDHPIAWCQNIDGGRSWYTAMGHTKESYAEPLFRLHLLGVLATTRGVIFGSVPAVACKTHGPVLYVK